jgi:hypothetical protein
MSMGVMNLISVLSLLFLFLPIGLFVAFWVYAIKHGWRSVWLFAIALTVSLGLSVFGIWLEVRENWLLQVGLGASVLSGIAILVSSKTSPQVAAMFGFGQRTNEPVRKSMGQIWGEIARFFYIVFGYWILIYFLNPKHFQEDFSKELWIVPVALALTIIKFLFQRLLSRWAEIRKNLIDK